MKRPKLGKETSAKLGMMHKMLKMLRMHSGASPFISDREDSRIEPLYAPVSPNYWKEAKIATLNAELMKGKAEMEWQRRSQLSR